MALPSQTERTTSGGRVSSRPGRGGPSRPIAIVLLVALAAGGAYAIYALMPSRTPTTPPRGLASNDPKADPQGTLTALPPEGGPGAPKTDESLRTVSKVMPSGTDVPGQETLRPAPVDVTSPDLAAHPAAEPQAPPPAPTQPLASTTSTSNVRAQMEQGEQALAGGKLVEARQAFSRAYLNPDCASADRAALRDRLQRLNAELMFSPKVTPGDPLVETYTVQAGDVLDKIRRRRELTVDSAFIARVNGMSNANSLRVGQKLKLVRGPFHVIVDKSDFRADVFAGSPDDTSSWTYIRSFPVGLGEGNSTPLGTYKIRNKMKNPYWKNPRTGEQFAADNPLNPIGEYWLGWEGLGDAKVNTGFGLHGTIDPASIGQQKSMGCVRMGNDDIAMVFEMLCEQVSTVRVVE